MKEPHWYGGETFVPAKKPTVIEHAVRVTQPADTHYATLLDQLIPSSGAYVDIPVYKTKDTVPSAHIDEVTLEQPLWQLVPQFPTQASPTELTNHPHAWIKNWKFRRQIRHLGSAAVVSPTQATAIKGNYPPIEAAFPSPLRPYTLDELNALPHRETLRHIQISQERALKRAKATYWLGRAALVPLAAATIFLLDQNTVAPLVWGDHVAVFHEVASNQFEAAAIQDRTDVFSVGGMGVENATAGIAEPLVPALSEGIPHSKLFGLEEGTHLFLPDTYKAFDHAVDENPAGNFVLLGMSTGSKEVLYLGNHARQKYPHAKMTFFLDSGPFDGYSAYSLRNNPSLIDTGVISTKLRLYGGPVLNSIVDITSNSTESKYYASNGQLLPKNFWQEIERIGRDVWTSAGTPNSLRVGQLGLIVDNSAQDNLEAIADANPDVYSIWVFYINPGDDHTIDDNYASQKYYDITNEINKKKGQVFVYTKDVLGYFAHASERANPGAYNADILKDLIIIRDTIKSMTPQENQTGDSQNINLSSK